MLFRLGESGYIGLLMGPSVSKEAEEVVKRKAASTLPSLVSLLATVGVTITTTATEENYQKAASMVAYLPMPGFVGAIQAEPDWFVTHDRKHFSVIDASSVSFLIGTPGDFILWLKENLKKRSEMD